MLHVLMLKKAQQDAKSVIEDGMTLVILGEKNHPEVKSINLWANNERYNH